MMDEERRPADEERTYDLLSRAEQGLEITARDDQDDWTAFLDAARVARRNGGRLRLIDTGRFSPFELEWLAEAGADLYTSDEARPNRAELGLLAKACARGDAVVAYFHHGILSADSEEIPTSPGFLAEAGWDGVDVHISSRERARDLAALAEIAHVCKGAGSRLVYYHHGSLDAGLRDLARSGGWIHISDLNLPAGEQGALLADIAAETSASGSGLVIHLEKGLAVETVRDLLEAGAFVFFKTPPADWRSSFRSLERRARKRTLDRRAYYLYPDFLP
jgi:hypothetical protein